MHTFLQRLALLLAVCVARSPARASPGGEPWLAGLRTVLAPATVALAADLSTPGAPTPAVAEHGATGEALAAISAGLLSLWDAPTAPVATAAGAAPRGAADGEPAAAASTPGRDAADHGKGDGRGGSNGADAGGSSEGSDWAKLLGLGDPTLFGSGLEGAPGGLGGGGGGSRSNGGAGGGSGDVGYGGGGGGGSGNRGGVLDMAALESLDNVRSAQRLEDAVAGLWRQLLLETGGLGAHEPPAQLTTLQQSAVGAANAGAAGPAAAAGTDGSMTGQGRLADLAAVRGWLDGELAAVQQALMQQAGEHGSSGSSSSSCSSSDAGCAGDAAAEVETAADPGHVLDMALGHSVASSAFRDWLRAETAAVRPPAARSNTRAGDDSQPGSIQGTADARQAAAGATRRRHLLQGTLGASASVTGAAGGGTSGVSGSASVSTGGAGGAMRPAAGAGAGGAGGAASGAAPARAMPQDPRPLRDAVADTALNVQRPVVRATERALQLYRIVAQDLGDGNVPFTGGRAQRRCEYRPYVFTPRVPDASPQTYTGPSFYVTRAGGNCVLVPEVAGAGANVWTQLYMRLACFGPSLQYLLLPASCRGVSDLPESLLCPRCVPTWRLGAGLDVSLYAADPPTFSFSSKEEFLAALGPRGGGGGGGMAHLLLGSAGGGGAGGDFTLPPGLQPGRVIRWLRRQLLQHIRDAAAAFPESQGLLESLDLSGFMEAARQLLLSGGGGGGRANLASSGDAGGSGGAEEGPLQKLLLRPHSLRTAIRRHIQQRGGSHDAEHSGMGAADVLGAFRGSGGSGALNVSSGKTAATGDGAQASLSPSLLAGMLQVWRGACLLCDWLLSAGGGDGGVSRGGSVTGGGDGDGTSPLLAAQCGGGVRGAVVIELGGGVGLGAVAAAMAGAARVVVTDVHAGARALAATNMAANSGLIAACRRRSHLQQHSQAGVALLPQQRRRSPGEVEPLRRGQGQTRGHGAAAEAAAAAASMTAADTAIQSGRHVQVQVDVEVCPLDWMDFLTYGGTARRARDGGGGDHDDSCGGYRANDGGENPSAGGGAGGQASTPGAGGGGRVPDTYRESGVGPVLRALEQTEAPVLLVAADMAYDPALNEGFAKCAAALLEVRAGALRRRLAALRQRQQEQEQRESRGQREGRGQQGGQGQQESLRVGTSASRVGALELSSAAARELGGLEAVPRLVVALERRYVFSLATLAAAAPAADDFMSYVRPAADEVSQVQELGRGQVQTELTPANAAEEEGQRRASDRPDRQPLFLGRRLPLEQVPQMLQYERCPQLELWELTLLAAGAGDGEDTVLT
ncbi:hypothetical protein HYH02_007956 [Chlamydomonas schloesseri]|uniref:Uncharacterized protein n=1 Tax=Chlamydomonas schloesseri TaxID=2026947 RepID=A0A836B473_9CHLO|nr:hypothetical protein HYH02_007956 [Chlamydomonas schloesseri]|eukprot:KAG2447216.1 hypothetical protein HYH02_007956 [Chlamydomonas schloesseri]